MAKRQGSLLPAVPDRSTLKGKRDYVILAPLVAVLLRWNELIEFDAAGGVLGAGRPRGKGRSIRTVATLSGSSRVLSAYRIGVFVGAMHKLWSVALKAYRCGHN
jgi:hypothetical protein